MALRETEQRHSEAQQRLAALQEPEEEIDAEELAQELEELERAVVPLTVLTYPAEGRQVLRKVLAPPLPVTPAHDHAGQFLGWNYHGEATLEGLLAGRLHRHESVPNPQKRWVGRG